MTQCVCQSLGISVKLVGENSGETFEGQISTVKIDLKKKKTSVLVVTLDFYRQTSYKPVTLT